MLIMLIQSHQIFAGNQNIEERLIRLEEGQKNLNNKFENLNQRMNEKFVAVNQRIDDKFDALNKRIDDMNKRFDDIDKRFANIDKRFDNLRSEIKDDINELRTVVHYALGGIFTVLMAIIGLIGFIIWDRRTALVPLQKEQEVMKNEFIVLKNIVAGLQETVDAIKSHLKGDIPLSAAIA